MREAETAQRSHSHRRDSNPARGYRGAFGAGARRRDPERPRIFRRTIRTDPVRNSPAAGACAWRLRRRCSPRPTFCCWTSPRTISTSKARSGWRIISPTIRAPSSSSATTATCSRRRSTRFCISIAASLRSTRAPIPRSRSSAPTRELLDAKHAKRQADERKRLQAFVDRFKAKASKARQAQSRVKMLERMKPVTALVTQDVHEIIVPAAGKDAVAADHRCR